MPGDSRKNRGDLRRARAPDGKARLRRHHPQVRSLSRVPEGPDALVGEYALVHVGFAISTVDAEEAARTYKLLEEMGEIMAQFEGEGAEPPEGLGGPS